MQRVVRTCAPIPPVVMPSAMPDASAPRRPSAFLDGSG
jgi:hypothetical protein